MSDVLPNTIVEDYVAYDEQGNAIIGTMRDASEGNIPSMPRLALERHCFILKPLISSYIAVDGSTEFTCGLDFLADAIGLTPDKICEGKVVMGIVGTGRTDTNE